MGCLRERGYRGFNCVDRSLHKAPLAPATFDPIRNKRDGGIARQSSCDFVICGLRRARIKVNSKIIPSRRELLGLPNYGVWIFMTQ